MVGRHVLDEAGGHLVRGTIQAIANKIPSYQGEVLGLTRDILVVQPPAKGTREVHLHQNVNTIFLLEQLSFPDLLPAPQMTLDPTARTLSVSIL